MQLLNKRTSTDSPIRQSADSADIVSDRQKQILEAMEVSQSPVAAIRFNPGKKASR